MTTTAERRRPRLSLTGPALSSVPLWAWVAFSRVLVMAAGAAGALFTRPVPGWQAYDPNRLSSSLGSVGNVLTASAMRWDAVGYVNIAQHGYGRNGSLVLFPLYPLLIRALTPILQSPIIAGLMVSLSAFSIGLWLIHRLARDELGSEVADTTVLLLAFAPWSFVFSADYTGSLLMLCCAAAFYLAQRGQRGRLVLACLFAAAGAWTHIQGILLVVPLAVLYWRGRGRSFDLRGLWNWRALALALPPLALGGLFVYVHLQGRGWLSPITSQNAANAGRAFVGPPMVLFDSVKDTVIGLREMVDGTSPPTGGLPPGLQNIVYLFVLVIALLALRSTWRVLPRRYGLFAALAILICTSSAVKMEPLKGFDRYMLPIFPLWIGAAAWVTERRITAAVVTLSATMLIVDTIQFTRWVSVF